MSKKWNQPYVSDELKDTAKCKICSDIGARMPMEGPLDLRISFCDCEIGKARRKRTCISEENIIGSEYWD